MKAYRPYETFGEIDEVREFETVEELIEYYRKWCKECQMTLEVADIDRDKGKICFIGINLKHYHESIELWGTDENIALENALEYLNIGECTEEQMDCLWDTIIY